MLVKLTTALATYINLERTESCTDNSQQWQKPSQHKQSLYPKGETIEALFGLEPLPAPTFQKNDQKLNKFAQLLLINNETNGMFYKAVTSKANPETRAKRVVNDFDGQKLKSIFQENISTFNSMVTISSGTKTIFRKFEATLSAEEKLFYEVNIEKSLDECCQTFTNTIGQYQNPNWFLQRRMRISASRFLNS